MNIIYWSAVTECLTDKNQGGNHVYPEKEQQNSYIRQTVPEYWISHEHKIILFSRYEMFIHMVFNTREEMMNSVMDFAIQGYRIG